MSSIEEIYKILKIKHSRRLNLVTGLYILFLASFCFALTQSLSNYYFLNFLILVGMISLYVLNFKVFRDSIKEKFLSELKVQAKYLIIAFVAFLVVNTSFFFFIKHTKSHVSLIIKEEKRVHAKMDSEKVTVKVWMMIVFICTMTIITTIRNLAFLKTRSTLNISELTR